MTSANDHKSGRASLRTAAAIGVLTLCTAGWLHGLATSPIIAPGQDAAIRPSNASAGERGDGELHRKQAEDYWRRYPDIRNHHYFGENGPLGFDGAWEHYRQHGRFEGRSFGPPAENQQGQGDRHGPTRSPPVVLPQPESDLQPPI